MVKTAAKRQVTYRHQLKARPSAPIEAMIEAERQMISGEWIGQLQGEDALDAIALVRDLAAQPAR